MAQVIKTDSDGIVKTLPKGDVRFFNPFKDTQEHFNTLITTTSEFGVFMNAESFAIEKKFYEHSQLQGQK